MVLRFLLLVRRFMELLLKRAEAEGLPLEEVIAGIQC